MSGLAPNTVGVDFNFYQEVVSASGSFPTIPQVIIDFRGTHNLIIVCTAGTPEISFNGNTVHGAFATTPAVPFQFPNHPHKKIWIRGTGTLRFYAYRPG